MANYSSGAQKRADENNEQIADNDSVQKKLKRSKKESHQNYGAQRP